MLSTLLRTTGIAAWTGCLLVLAYQALTWVLTASWPSLTTLDALSGVLGIDFLTIINNLPAEYAAKAIYVFMTTELSLTLWWAGVCFFALTLVYKVVFNR